MKIEITGESIAKSVKRAWCLGQMPLAMVTVLGVLVLGFIAYGQSREIATLNEQLNLDSKRVIQLEQRLKLHKEAINENSAHFRQSYQHEGHPPLTD